jgi:hypothetical protein
VRVTLDTNAIIDLEEHREAEPALRELIGLYRDGTIRLCVSAIAASERDYNPEGRPDFARFIAKLATADLSDVELLSPIAVWNVTFWDNCVFGDGDTLQAPIRAILFPDLNTDEIPGETAEARAKRDRQGRNALCDILSMWCHIRYGGHIFVTRDGNFHKATKKPRLVELGAGQVLTAQEALAFIRAASDATVATGNARQP